MQRYEKFYRHMKKNEKTATVTSRPEVHLPDAPGGSPNYCGCIHVNCVDCK